ncbi:MAG: hypothetical protein R3A13_06880 [Bdellovibrionota bacterium]
MESGNSMPAVNPSSFTYLTPFPGQSKARLYTKDCDSNGTCSFRSLAEVEHPIANNPAASTLPIVIVAEKYRINYRILRSRDCFLHKL